MGKGGFQRRHKSFALWLISLLGDKKKRAKEKKKEVSGWNPSASLDTRRRRHHNDGGEGTAPFASAIRYPHSFDIESDTVYYIAMKNGNKKYKEKKERAEPPFPLVTSKSTHNYRDAFAAVAKLLEGRKKVLVLAGAGQSVSCGIPDFRSRGSGLYSMLDTEVSDFSIGYF